MMRDLLTKKSHYDNAFKLCGLFPWSISTHGMGLEDMPFGRVPSNRVMTPSWGERGLKAGARNLAPQGSSTIFIFYVLFVDLDRQMLHALPFFR
jgi:hypothetical protein